MGTYTTRIAWETLRVLDTSTSPFSTGVYTPIGTPLAHPSYICKMVNNSTVLVTISIDSVTDIDVLPANSFWLYDESKGINGIGPLIALPKGTQFYVKSGTGGAGTESIYLVTQFLLDG